MWLAFGAAAVYPVSVFKRAIEQLQTVVIGIHYKQPVPVYIHEHISGLARPESLSLHNQTISEGTLVKLQESLHIVHIALK